MPTSATNGCMPSAIPIICASHLRERSTSAERSPSQPWATNMITLLCQANAVVGEDQDQDLETLPARNVEHLRTRYNTILSKAVAGNPPRPGTRGRVKQAPTCNLIRRLREHRNEVLPALPHQPARSLRQQPGRTRPAHAQDQAKSLWLLPLRYRYRGLCHPPLLPLNSSQTIRRYCQLARPDLPGQPPMPPLE